VRNLSTEGAFFGESYEKMSISRILRPLPNIVMPLADGTAGYVCNAEGGEYEAPLREPWSLGYYLADSFGKDSTVLLSLAKRSGVAFDAHHSLTTIDPPELIWYGRKHHSETMIDKPEKSFWQHIGGVVSLVPAAENHEVHQRAIMALAPEADL